MAAKFTLKEARQKKGLSQNQLANKIDMSLQNIQRIEYGTAKSIPLDTLEKLCFALECTPNDLIEFTPDSRAS